MYHFTGGYVINFVELLIYMSFIGVILLVMLSVSFIMGGFIADSFNLSGIIWWAFVILFIMVICKVLSR